MNNRREFLSLGLASFAAMAMFEQVTPEQFGINTLSTWEPASHKPEWLPGHHARADFSSWSEITETYASGQVGGVDCSRRLSFAFLRNHVVDNFRLPVLLLNAVYQIL